MESSTGILGFRNFAMGEPPTSAGLPVNLNIQNLFTLLGLVRQPTLLHAYKPMCFLLETVELNYCESAYQNVVNCGSRSNYSSSPMDKLGSSEL